MGRGASVIILPAAQVVYGQGQVGALICLWDKATVSGFIVVLFLLNEAYAAACFEIQFIIAHECGHIAMEHMLYHTAGSLAKVMGGYLPVIGPALSNDTANCPPIRSGLPAISECTIWKR